MKAAFCSLLLALALLPALRADIQNPPASEQSATRKLGRGAANLIWGWSEVPDTIGQVNDDEGNAAAFAYGAVRGVGRALARMGIGFVEVITWPFPTNRDTYKPILRSDIPWIHGGFQEFPPELGWESRFPYTRETAPF